MLSSGSGIYAPDGARTYYYNMKNEDGRLLIAELDSHPRLSPASPPAVSWSSYASSVERFSPNDHDFSGLIFHDQFTFIELTKPEGNLTVCQKDLCCHLSYKMAGKQEDEVYVLGAFDGLHVVEGQYYLQVMILWMGGTYFRKLLHREKPSPLWGKQTITFLYAGVLASYLLAMGSSCKNVQARLPLNPTNAVERSLNLC